MSEQLEILRVFIASPGDVAEERNIVEEVCRKLNDDPFVGKLNIHLKVDRWENLYPSAGRVQDIINPFVKDCDLFVCVFCKRLGSPIGKEESGTLEEFLLAYDQWKEKEKPVLQIMSGKRIFSAHRRMGV